MFVIAGATGRVGGVVAQTLLTAHQRVRVLVRSPEAAATWRARGAEAVVAPLQDAAAVTNALFGARGCFLLVPENPQAHDVETPRQRIVDALVQAVRASRVPHVVLLSASAAVLPRGNGPAAILHQAENRLRERTPVVTALRPCAFQENLAALIGLARTTSALPCFAADPEAPAPSIATRDVGHYAASRLLQPPTQHEIVDLLGPLASAATTARELGAALERELELVLVRPEHSVALLMQGGVSRAYATSVAELAACFAEGRVRPAGDRVVHGATPLADTLTRIVQAGDPIETITDAIVASWNRHDITAFGRLYTEDAEFVNIFGDWLRGRDAIVADLGARHRGPFRATTMSSRPSTVRQLRPDVVVVHQPWRVSGNLTPEGSALPDRAGLLLHVMRRRQGRWAIEATHNTQTPLEDWPAE